MERLAEIAGKSCGSGLPTTCHPAATPASSEAQPKNSTMTSPSDALSDARDSKQVPNESDVPRLDVARTVATPCRAEARTCVGHPIANKQAVAGLALLRLALKPTMLASSDTEVGSASTVAQIAPETAEVPEVATWPCQEDVHVIQITLGEGNAICTSLAGQEMFRFSRALGLLTVGCLRTKIQENYERAMDITLFADAQLLRPDDTLQREQPLLAKCSYHIPELWVVKWVDFSSKYGVGYVLSDDSVGVFFNDSTKMVWLPATNQFDYITRRTEERPEQRSIHTFDDYPEDLRKKVTLLRHFKNFLIRDDEPPRGGATTGKSSLPSRKQASQSKHDSGQLDYVRKWGTGKFAIVFALSNKSVQFVFDDATELLRSSRSNVVTYVNNQKQVCSYPLTTHTSYGPELAKRFKYVQDFLDRWQGFRNQPAVARADQA